VSDQHNFYKNIDSGEDTNFGPSMSWIDVDSKFAFEKIARAHSIHQSYIPETLQQTIESIRGKLPKDKVAFYNRALGSFESYGLNKNGDGWFREELMRKHATFVSDAAYFRDHLNKIAIHPHFGRPIASAFNEKTDMVDLIILADFDKVAENDIQMLERGGRVFTSMGCRVKFDVCTICGHQAPAPDHYCEHVRKHARHPYGMGQVLADGRVCGVMNPDPIFFDISRLDANPAFVGSENLMKVAAAMAGGRGRRTMVQVKSERSVRPATAVKSSHGCGTTKKAEEKQADMVKTLPATTEAAVVGDRVIAAHAAAAPRLPVAALIKKAGSMTSALKGSLALGVIWSPDEFREGVKIASGKDPGPQSWPSRVKLASGASALSASSVAAWGATPLVDLTDELASVAEDRSLLQPLLFNRCQHLKVAQNSGAGEKQSLLPNADPSYSLYRALCVRGLEGSFSGIDTEKIADTMVRTTSKMSKELALGLWTKESDCGALEKKANASNTGPALLMTGSMMENLGAEALDQMARNTLT
jgi:hypothetical protein